MGSFEEVSTGDGNLRLGGVDAGFIRNVNFAVTSEELELWTGAPEQFEGAIPTRQGATLTCEALELSIPNISKFLGNAVYTELGDPVAVVDQELTFGNAGNYDGSLERIFLDGPGVTAITVESLAEVAYVEGTDWILDGTSKNIIRLDSGDITEGETVVVSYTYTPVEALEIRGGVSFQRQRFPLEFTHPKITKGTNLVLTHSIVEPSANFSVNFSSGDFIAPSVEFKFVRDNASSAPLYRLREVLAA